VIRVEQVLPGSEGVKRGRQGGEGGQDGEMTQTMYAHVNKLIKNIFKREATANTTKGKLST
jgi:hypothetical protein